MIRLLDNTNISIAEEIHAIWQISYVVEAKLLNAPIFPPLQRTKSNFIESTTDFYGYFLKNKLAAVMEIGTSGTHTHIQSLVVNPNYFRKGIGEKLVSFAFETYNTPAFSVETGSANHPAIFLYKKLGFIEVMQYIAAHGIRKIRFEKRI